MSGVQGLLSALRKKDVRLRIEGNELRVDAPRGALTQLDLQALRDNKQSLLDFLKNVDAEKLVSPILRQGRPEALPLSFAQQRLWFIDQLEGAGAAYHLPGSARLHGKLNREALQVALDSLVERHETLRTTFSSIDGNPVQVIAAEARFQLKYTDLTGLAADERETEVARLASEEAQMRFDLSIGPLIRGQLIRVAVDEHVLLLMMHHIVSDGWSMGVVISDLAKLYTAHCEGRRNPLIPLLIQYADYAIWQRSWLRDEALDQQLNYWKSQLRGAPAQLDLPKDRPRPATSSYRGDGVGFMANAELTRQLNDFARAQDATLFMVLCTAFSILLSRLSGQEDIVIGTPVANRQRVEVEPLVGFFVNTLTLRIRLDADISIAELLRQVREVTLGAYDHEDLPFEQIVDALQPRRALNHTPLFQTMLVLQNTPEHEIHLPGLRLSPQGVDNKTAKFDLRVSLVESGGQIFGDFNYSSDLFDRETVTRWAGHFHALLTGMVRDANNRVCAIPLLDNRERQQLIREFNPTRLEYPKGKLVHELFEEHAARAPAAIAVVDEATQLSYGELNERANQLAHWLREHGVSPDRRVAICVERSVELVVGLLGILKAGGAYVPLDPSYPRERLEYMLKDSAPAVLLTQEHLKSLLSGTAATQICLDSQWEEIGQRSRENLAASGFGLDSSNLAYVIYTSGSMGQPKGVMIQHASVINLWAGLEQAIYQREPRCQRVGVNASFAFDASVKQWVQLLSGRTLVLVPDAARWDARGWLEFVQRQAVEAIDCTPSQLNLLMAAGLLDGRHRVPAVMLVGGEPIDATLWATLAAAPEVTFYNVYGPTECTVDATVGRIKDLAPTPSLGRPIANTQIYILDQHRQPVPIGVAGEIHIGGDGVARGYLNRPELTAERFIADPFGSDPQARLYKSGDVGRLRADGTIECLGRNDHQVKIRGFRIELGEIEAKLAEHSQVRKAVVIAREDVPGEKRLVAYLTSHEPAPDSEALRAYLKLQLPEYMVPSAYVLLESLPLTANGKLDRGSLPAPELDAYATKTYEAPQGVIESALATIWQDLLRVDRVGRNDNFFELGGHSLLIVQLIERLRRHGLAAEVRSVFSSSSLSALASSLTKASGSNFQAPPNLIPIDCTTITPAMLPLIELTQAQIEGIVAAVPGGVRNVQDLYPLAPLQEGILFHHVLNERSDAYVLPNLISLDSREQLDALLSAIQAVIDRHDVLRTAILWKDLPRAVQVVHRRVALSVSELSPDETKTPLTRLKNRMAPGQMRIDLQCAPLIRVEIAQGENDGPWYALLYYHHIISDHVALDQILREVDAHLTGTNATLTPPIPYREYVAHSLARTKTHDATAFFRSRLSDIDEPTAPFGLLDVQGDGSRIEEVRQAVDAGLSKRIRRSAQRLNVSAATLFHAAYALVIAHTSNRDEVVFGSVLLGRLHGSSGMQQMLGMFINTLPLRVSLKDFSAHQLIESLQGELGQLVEYEHASLAEAQRCSGIVGNAPLFTAVLNYRHSAPVAAGADHERRDEGTSGGLRLLGGHERTNYPFMVSVDDLGEGFLITAQIDRQVEARQIAAYLHTAIESLVQALEERAQVPARALSILPPNERDQLLHHFNSTAVEYPKDRLIHELFEEQVGRTPDAIAVVYEAEQLTYRELDKRSNLLAHYLRQQGVRPDGLVAICVERSVEMVVGLLGILKAGGAYVPLDPSYPRERLEYMLKDAGASVVLTQEHVRSVLPPSAATTIALDTQWEEIAKQSSRDVSGSDAGLASHHLAYVIYTSGSTGQPKGAMNEHGAVVNRLRWMQQAYALTSNDRVLQKTPFSFDVSVWEFFWTLLNGARLVMARPQGHQDPEYLSKLIRDEGITTAHFVPSMLQVFLEHGHEPGDNRLRQVICSGEALSVELQNRCLDVLPQAKLHNLYGPTEAAIDVTYWECRTEPGQSRVPIGRPIANTQIYLMDRHRQPVPLGVIGELYIGGVGVARGYLNRPELTAERFLADPFSPDPQARIYKSGDLARYRPDGTIEYLGRNDHQVKIRGFRIELGEIEAKLAEHPQIEDAVVLAREDIPGEKRLVAYLTHTDPVPDSEALRSYLKPQLPEYMIPSAYVLLESLPLTASGKLDRKALPAPELGAYAAKVYEAPQGEAESTLATIWQELLQLERVGRNDNFFELGGHSLLIVQLIERLRRAGLTAEVRGVFNSPSLSALASTLAKASSSEFQAPPNLIPEGCESITPAMLPLIELTQAQIDRIVSEVPGGAANVQDLYPLAPLQEGILFHHVLNERSDAYVLPSLMSLDSREQLDALLSAIQAVIDRHDVLRTAILWRDLPRAVQVVHRRVILSVSELSFDGAQETFTQLSNRMAPGKLRIDLQSAPLIQVDIAQEKNGGPWYALLYYHHIISDHVALEQILREVDAHLTGMSGTLSAPIPYRQYVAQALARAKTHDATAFFRSRLSDIGEPTAPFGLMDVQGDGSRIDEVRQAVDAGLSKRIRRSAQRLNVSAATLFHAAYALVIAHSSNREDVVFGSVLLGRLHGASGVQQMLGMFINTLPLRLSLNELSSRQLVERTRDELAQLLQYEHAALAEAQRCSGIVGNAPLFTAVLNYRHSAPASAVDHEARDEGTAGGLRLLGGHERTNYPFTVSVDDLGEGFAITAQIDREVDAQRVASYVNAAIESLVQALESQPDAPALQVSILPPSEREQLLHHFNATSVEYPKDRLIHELFEEQVDRTPDAVAVVSEAEQLTYRELNERSNQLAHYLRQHGVGPDGLVAICVERSVEMVVGLLGILKAGGAYVPLDPSYPRERLEYMLKDAGASVVLTQEYVRSVLPPSAATTIALDTQWEEIAKQPKRSVSANEVGLTANHLAYVIYTSGSTGQPKGAMNEHGAVVNRLQWMQQAYALTSNDRVLQKTPFSFDVSVWEFFWTLLNGACLVVARPQGHQDPEYLGNLIRDEGITTAHFVPSMLQVFLEHGGQGTNRLRQVICSGEALPVELQNRCLELLPQAKLHNLYGPTEAAIDVTYWECRVESGQSRVPIGRPIANTQIYLLDRNRQPVPLGVIGELYIGGVGVARGYLNRPELTAERFLADPFSSDPQARIYKSGDLARYRPDGTIEYLGRNDTQVKIRGFRIELGEIEAKLAEHPQVREAVVIAREDLLGEKRLVAYFTHTEPAPDSEALRASLKSQLPEYMIPSAYVPLDSLPLTSNGKLDRKALPAPELGAYATKVYEAPQSQIEISLAGIWQELLQVERVGRHDNFFELGGHSLLLVRMLGIARDSLAIDIPMRTIFQTRTLAELGQVLRTEKDVDEEITEDGLI